MWDDISNNNSKFNVFIDRSLLLNFLTIKEIKLKKDKKEKIKNYTINFSFP